MPDCVERALDGPEPTSLCGLYCIGFLAFVAFGLLVATAIVVGIEGGSALTIVLISFGALVTLLLFGCLCFWLPSKERSGRAYDAALLPPPQ